MPNLNKVMLMGNLTRDPEVKYLPKGTAVMNCSLAVNRHYTTESGEKREEVTFVEFEMFGKRAEVVAEYFRKGHPIYIEGRLKLDQWDDKTTGKKMSKLRVLAESFEFLGGRKDEDTQHEAERPHKSSTFAQRQKPPPDPDLDAPEDDIPF